MASLSKARTLLTASRYAHVAKCQGQYISNVCMKFNAKLGGTTCRAVGPTSAGPLGQFKVPTMVIGADVSHAVSTLTSESVEYGTWLTYTN